METRKKNQNTLLTFAALCLLLEATLIVSDILTFKVTNIFSITFTIPALLYPLTYAIGDTITEAYGRRTTLIILIIAIFIEVIFDVIISYSSTIHSTYDQHYFEAFYYAMNKMYIAGIGVAIGSILGFLTNTMIMSFLKSKFSYKSFPIRSICSSLSGEIIFTIVAFSIWFYSDKSVNAHAVAKLIATSISLKIIFAILYSYPAFWVTKFLIKNNSAISEKLKIIEIINLSDKPGNSIFSFQIAGKRVCFSSKSNKVTMNMYYSLNDIDKKLIESDLKGNITSQLDTWARNTYAKNSIDSRWNERDWTRNSEDLIREKN